MDYKEKMINHINGLPSDFSPIVKNILKIYVSLLLSKTFIEIALSTLTFFLLKYIYLNIYSKNGFEYTIIIMGVSFFISIVFILRRQQK